MSFSFIQIEHIGRSNHKETQSIKIIQEEPLSIRIQGKPYSVVMRTPGYEKEHGLGLCFTEGIIDKLKDISTVGICKDKDINILTVTLTKDRASKISELLEDKNYISNTSCGICGKEMIADISKGIKPFKDNLSFHPRALIDKIERIGNYQPLRIETKATHCSVIYDRKLMLLSSAEDVGRHNALDKSIGSLFLNGTLEKAKLLTLSSRVSYELVQKAARARIPVICAISRPTSLAVGLAKKLNITLVTLSPKNGLIVYCNKHRIGL